MPCQLGFDAVDALRTDERAEPGPKDDLIIDTVLAQIEAVGYDAVELRTIARDARVSLATIYKSFPSRDALLLAAVKQWMGRQVWGSMVSPDPRASSSDRLCAVMHAIFEPWLDHPRMLEAFVRVTERSGGDELSEQGAQAVAPLIVACFEGDADPGDVAEILEIVRYVISGLMSDYAHGVMTAEEILPALDMTVRRLTGHMAAPAP
jgi:AcrR family transcriptional regulator